MRSILRASAAVIVTIPTSTPFNKLRNNDHHVLDSEGKITGFQNPWPSFVEQKPSLPWLFGLWQDYRGSPTPPATLLPQIRAVDWGKGLPGDWKASIKSTWLGHACFLVEFPISGKLDENSPVEKDEVRGIRVLFDPIFSQRCSPSQYVGPARVTQPPFKLEKLPHVDAVIISHNHYDHTDVTTLKHIYAASEKGTTHFFTPLGTKSWFESIGFASSDVSELDWFDERELVLEFVGKIKVTCTKAQHFSGRSINDRSKTLWASWAVESFAVDGKKNGSVWFGGDTGRISVPRGFTGDEDTLPSCPAFREIGEHFKDGFDLGLIPIGAYSPRSQMSRIHCSPEDSTILMIETGSRRSVGGHWGTFILTDEEMTEPPKRLAAAVKAKGLDAASFTVTDIGETILVTPA